MDGAGEPNPEWLFYARALPQNSPFKVAEAGIGSCVPLTGQHPLRCATRAPTTTAVVTVQGR